MATDGTSHLLHWSELFQLAMVELDPAKLPARIGIHLPVSSFHQNE
jgi:hypothetical protein